MRGDSLGELEQLVMFAVVRLDGQATADRLCEDINTRTDRLINPSLMHGTLDRLRRRRLVRKRIRSGITADGRARDRLFFSATRSGLNALKASYINVRAMAKGVVLK